MKDGAVAWTEQGKPHTATSFSKWKLYDISKRLTNTGCVQRRLCADGEGPGCISSSICTHGHVSLHTTAEPGAPSWEISFHLHLSGIKKQNKTYFCICILKGGFSNTGTLLNHSLCCRSPHWTHLIRHIKDVISSSWFVYVTQHDELHAVFFTQNTDFAVVFQVSLHRV